uniref:Uncharacterized protein n=1 Tax=Arundo donax TaxID=35708 RepID=A0A0A9ES71_ARUDO
MISGKRWSPISIFISLVSPPGGLIAAAEAAEAVEAPLGGPVAIEAAQRAEDAQRRPRAGSRSGPRHGGDGAAALPHGAVGRQRVRLEARARRCIMVEARGRWAACQPAGEGATGWRPLDGGASG